MELIADFLLLAATGCACFYCWTLSRRLQKLHSTKDGIAASLASLSKSVDETKQAIAHSHLAAEESIKKLEPLIASANQLQADLAEAMRAHEERAAAAETVIERPFVETVIDDAPSEEVQPNAEDEAKQMEPDLDALEPAADVTAEEDDEDDGSIDIEWNDPEEDEERDVISLEQASA